MRDDERSGPAPPAPPAPRSSTRERNAVIRRLHDEDPSRTLRELAELTARERPDWRVSVGTVSRVLAAGGRRKRRATRPDAGKPRDRRIEQALPALLALKCRDRIARARPGKLAGAAMAPSALVVEEAKRRGLVPADFTAAQLNRLLRARGVHQRGAEAKRTGPGVVRRYEAARAGARFLFDGTIMGAFYLDASGDFVYMPDTELKQQLKQAGKTRAHILAMVDDHSRALRLGVYDGETARNFVAFLRECFCRPDDPQRIFGGLPATLYADNGSAATSAIGRGALRALGVKLICHRPRTPWSKGKVEAALRRTEGYQRLTKGQPIRSFTEAREFVRGIELELNNGRMAAIGEAPYERFLRSAREQDWAYAPADAAFWRRLAMLRLTGLQVRSDLTLRLGAGEMLALPCGRPFVDLVGRRVDVLVETRPGDGVRAPRKAGEWTAAGGETCIVVVPQTAGAPEHEREVPRVGPEVYRSLQRMPEVETTAAALVKAARAACEAGAIEGPLGAWFGAGAPRRDAPAGRIAEAGPGDGAGRILPQLAGRHEAKRALLEAGFDLADPATERELERLFAGEPACERWALDHLIETGKAPEQEEAA